jgi:hypothetical protein
MPQNLIRPKLEALRSELDSDAQALQTDSVVSLRRKLDDLIRDLDEADAESLPHRVKAIQDHVADLEISHPKVTSALNQVSHLLSSLGI